MSLAALAQAIGREESRRRSLWKLIAYAGRYGSTSPTVARRMTVNDLVDYTEALGEIIDEENKKPE